MNVIINEVKNPLVTIVVPAYNAEKYIEDCLSSLINQTYTNLEIILLNDGSTDKTHSICNNYASKDKRIKYINKENTGVSNTRNVALDMCKGDYLLFVDSDDWISKNCVETLIKNIGDNDILRFNTYTETFKHEWKIEKFHEYSHQLSEQEIIDLPINIACPQEYEKRYGNYGDYGYVSCKFYKTECLKNVRFREDLKLLEDADFFLRVTRDKIKILCLDEPMYYYRFSDNAATKKYRKNLLQETKDICKYFELFFQGENKKYFYSMKFNKFVANLINLSHKENFKYTDVKKICNDELWNFKIVKPISIYASKKIYFTYIIAKFKFNYLIYIMCLIKKTKNLEG